MHDSVAGRITITCYSVVIDGLPYDIFEVEREGWPTIGPALLHLDPPPTNAELDLLLDQIGTVQGALSYNDCMVGLRRPERVVSTLASRYRDVETSFEEDTDVPDDKKKPSYYPKTPADVADTAKEVVKELGLPEPKKWPRWLRWLLSVPIILLLAFFFRDKRLGSPLYDKISGQTSMASWKVQPFEEEPKITVDFDQRHGLVQYTYLNGTAFPADGLAAAFITAADDAQQPERLAPYKALIKDTDFPLVVFMNASGFDPTGEPICIRRAADGGVVYKAPDLHQVRLAVPLRDGQFLLFLLDGTTKKVSEAEWMLKAMRMPLANSLDPKELEKLSDEELRKRGLERISEEEAIKRGLIPGKKAEFKQVETAPPPHEKGEVFPRPRPPKPE